jgi:DNA polymerase III delta prime subunit
LSTGGIDPAEFAESFRRLLDWVERAADSRQTVFSEMLAEHFGAEPTQYPVTAESLSPVELPNLQLALDAYLGGEGVGHRLSGFAGPVEDVHLSLAGLVHDEGFGIRLGPVSRRVVELDGGRPLPCVTSGLFLLSNGDRRLAVLLTENESGLGRPTVRLEAMAPDAGEAERLLAELRALRAEHNVYRGKVLSLDGGGDFGDEDMAIQFRRLPEVARDEIVLPDGVLDTVELHTVEFARQAAKLLAGGRHLRRGLLLHGPPGTGKTLTVSYLIQRLPGRTVIILTGGALGLISEACTLARDLAPAMVVLEDVDLVAQERMMAGSPTSLLFELMNQIDGIGVDSDVIFLMTTNRAGLLEPALAARPGRVDQAVAIPLPDAGARRQLLDLYCRGLNVELRDDTAVIEATDGVSAAFIRELVRKAALLAARDGDETLTDLHFSAALDLLAQGGSVTRAMLGGAGAEALEALDEQAGSWIVTAHGQGGGLGVSEHLTVDDDWEDED